MKILKSLTLLPLLFVIACTESNSKKGQSPFVVREGFTNGSCFDVQQFEAMFQGPLASHAVQITTTKLEPVSSQSQMIDLLMSYKVFGVQRTTGSKLGILPTVVKQEGCDSAEFRSLGGPTLKYRVTVSAIDQLSLKLSKSAGDATPEYRRESLVDTPQPIAYDFKLLDNNRIEVSITYKSFNPTCNSDKLFTYRIKKLIEWQNADGKLAKTVRVDKAYLTQYFSALHTPPAAMDREDLSVAEVQNLAKQSARPDLLSCHM